MKMEFYLTGTRHGSNVEKSFVFNKPITLKAGLNQIAPLGATVGLPVKI